MKIKKLFLCALINCSLFSCNGKTAINENIETAFNQHVQENFDNPKDLMEIISITIDDTISSQKAIAFANKILQESDSTIIELDKQVDSLHNVNMDRFEYIKKNSKLSQKYRADNNTMTVLMNTFNARSLEIEYVQSKDYKSFKSSRSTCHELIDSLQTDSITVFIYEIKTRCLVNNEPKIKRFYAHVTSVDKIEITDNNSTTNYPNISQLYKELDNFIILYGNWIKVKLSVLEAEQKQYKHFK